MKTAVRPGWDPGSEVEKFWPVLLKMNQASLVVTRFSGSGGEGWVGVDLLSQESAVAVWSIEDSWVA